MTTKGLVKDAEATLARMTATPESAAVTDVIFITVPSMILSHATPTVEERIAVATANVTADVIRAATSAAAIMIAAETAATTRDVLMHMLRRQNTATPGHVTKHAPGLRPQDPAVQETAQDAAPGTVLAEGAAALPAQTSQ